LYGIFQFCYDIFCQAELELLLMNDGTERNHFSLKSIQEQEEEGKKKHKKKLKKKLIKQESKKDDFEVILQETALILYSCSPLHIFRSVFCPLS
jgi:hypothetical protein